MPRTRSYPFTFSIPAANTWTKIVVTIPGDTGWNMGFERQRRRRTVDASISALARPIAARPTHGRCGRLLVGVTGAVSVVATNAAVLLVTGVKLEIGSVATPFNRQSLAKSMADCQRYYQVGVVSSAIHMLRSNMVCWFDYQSISGDDAGRADNSLVSRHDVH